MSSAIRFVIAGSLVLAGHSIARGADYPPVPPPPQQYYPPPPPAYQPPPQQPMYPPPPPVYQPPPQVYMPPPPPPMVVQQPVVYQPAVVSDFGSWYLRGDVGISAQKFTDFPHTQTNSVFVWPRDWKIEHTDIKDAMFFSLGVGYHFTKFFRVDFTGEYRQSTKGKVTGSYGENCAGGGTCFDVYDFDHQATLFMLNAYLDMGTWWCFTPFVGLGIGGAYHTFHAFTDVGLNSDGTTGFGVAKDIGHDWTFAWAIHAGIAYEVTKSFHIELAYRYLSLGSPDTQIIGCGAFGCAGAGPRAFYTLTDFTANELRLGVRWNFDCCDVPPPPMPPPPPPPLMRRG
jgi:opacity protein-like surface antigen